LDGHTGGSSCASLDTGHGSPELKSLRLRQGSAKSSAETLSKKLSWL
jgi:hypothetical protein